jgi:hypothetical protein
MRPTPTIILVSQSEISSRLVLSSNSDLRPRPVYKSESDATEHQVKLTLRPKPRRGLRYI